MCATDAVRAQIREGKTHQVGTTIATGRKYGMFTLDQDLARLVRTGKVLDEVARERCQDVSEYKRFLEMGEAAYEQN